MGLWMILLFIVQWLYPVFFEVLGSGQTLGKRVLRLRVLMNDGLPVTWEASLLRNLLRVVDALPGAYTVGLISTLLSRDFQRVGDLVAGTLVVHVPEAIKAMPIPETAARILPVSLSLEEQSALLAFGERSSQLNPARAEELAAILELLTGLRGEAGVRALQGMARHIRGLA
jgi:hypothetical protein